MKRFLIVMLIFLTGCSSASTQALDSIPPTASFFNLTPDPAGLTLDSTSGQIQNALRESAPRWSTLQMDGTVTWYMPDGSTQSAQEKAWLDPLNNKFKVELNGMTNNSNRIIKLSDGATIFDVNIAAAQVQTFSYPDSARVGQYVPELVEGTSYPNPIWGQIGTPLSNLAFASDYSQTSGTFVPVAVETIAGRETLAVNWTYAENSSPALKIWIDTQIGIILKLQQFDKSGKGTLETESVVNMIVINPAFDNTVFSLPPEVLALVLAPENQVGTIPFVTESSPPLEEEAGELYFFYQPRQQSQAIQLVKVSGVCVYNSVCPPLESIQTPFPFIFNLNALSWSPDGKYAAFSYSDQPAGTPTKLWLFDADAKTWTSLAQFPYIDPPFWSPDGSWIAFRTQDGLGGEEVYVVRPNGTELKSVSTALAVEGRPYIMDGWYTENIIMRSALPGSVGSVYLVRAANGQARPMFETLLTKAEFIASPDAGFLAYDEQDANTQTHVLKVMEPDGANAVTIAYFTGGSIYPMVWSPDSSLIAFNYYSSFANGEPSAEVYVVSHSGGVPSLVYKGTTVGRLLFSPNGKYLLVEETTSISGGHLFLINLATLEQKILEAPGLSTEYDWYAPSWRP